MCMYSPPRQSDKIRTNRQDLHSAVVLRRVREPLKEDDDEPLIAMATKKRKTGQKPVPKKVIEVLPSTHRVTYYQLRDTFEKKSILINFPKLEDLILKTHMFIQS